MNKLVAKFEEKKQTCFRYPKKKKQIEILIFDNPKRKRQPR